ncbi:MAG: hypothetical protein NT062_10030 [Proteobacteria bacterium]|nr:hypothetical protein [Pseudomonadota bacterium]
MRILAIIATLALALAHPAQADTAVGVFAPSAPFASTGARVELANKLAAHLAKGLGGTGIGRAYARSGDFAAAIKKGEVTIAVVDAAYLAIAGGTYTVIATATRNGEASQGWQLVAKGVGGIAQLEGKRILVPAIGGRENDFVLNVLLGGEVRRDFFAKVEAAPDTTSTLAALGLGKADAAVVPTGVELPAGFAKVLGLPSLSTPMLVAYGVVTAAQKSAIAAAAISFRGEASTIGGFAVGGDGAAQLARRFAVPQKRGPLVVPAVRLLVGDLVEGRTFAIERSKLDQFIAK